MTISKNLEDFHGGPVVENLPASEGDTGPISVLEDSTCQEGNYAHASQLLSQRPTTHALKQEKPLHWEALAPQLESSPHLLQLEKARAQQWRPRAAKNKVFLNFKKGALNCPPS